MWRFADPRRLLGRRLRYACAAAILLAAPAAAADTRDAGFWLKFGKPVRLCPGAKKAVPAKLEGATWGVLASGILSCQDAGARYVLKVDYLNVFVDPGDHAVLEQPTLKFDWLGLALYRPAASGRDVDWLVDQTRPVKGELRRDGAGRIVFGDLVFSIPKREAEGATNMLFYLTFGGPLVAINVR